MMLYHPNNGKPPALINWKAAINISCKDLVTAEKTVLIKKAH